MVGEIGMVMEDRKSLFYDVVEWQVLLAELGIPLSLGH